MRAPARTLLPVLFVVAIVTSGLIGHLSAYAIAKPRTETITRTVTEAVTVISTERLVETHTVFKVTTAVFTETITLTETMTYRAVETLTLRMRIAPPIAAEGLLVIMGGRTFDEAYRWIIEWSGKARPRVGVIPTASGTPIETGMYYVEVFESYGAEGILINITEHNCAKTAYDAQYVELVRSLDAVFFTGGDQNRIARCLVPGGTPTPVLEALWALYLRGGVISGNSAGAAIMSDPMIGGGMDERVIITQGFGFLMYGRVIVDQHFLARGRVFRLVEALIQTGVRLGVGIDEGSALVCFGNYTCRVIGLAPVVVFTYEGYNGTHHIFKLNYLTPGDSIDLRTLKVEVGHGKRALPLVGNSAVTADVDVKSQDGLSALIGLLVGNREVRASVLSESRRFLYQVTLTRTARTSIHDTGSYGALRYTALEVLLYISKVRL